MRKILLVDDDVSVGEFLGEFLEEEGYQVKYLGQPQRALEEIGQSRYDLLIADLRMPGMSGLELAGRAKELSPGILCIVITGYGSLDSMRQAMRLGVNDYLVKPCTLEELADAVQASFAASERLRVPEMTSRP